MRAALHIPVFTWQGGPAEIGTTLGDVAAAAEDVGFASLSVMDHFFQLEFVGPADMEMLEGYTTLGYLAGRTSSIELGLLVTGVTYRHPGLLAKTVTTLDVLSGGRAKLAVGAAWYEREHDALGVPFPPLAERFERLEEAIQISLQMWSDDDGPFEGRHYHLAETINSPQALTKPHPPVLIGGAGERKTLKLVARYAQACNIYSEGHDTMRHKLAVLRKHCADEGRDYGSIQKTMLYMGPMPSGGSVGAFCEDMAGYAELGIEMVYLMPYGNDPLSLVEEAGSKLIPALEGL